MSHHQGLSAGWVAPVRQLKFKCVTCSYFFIQEFSYCFQEQEEKKKCNIYCFDMTENFERYGMADKGDYSTGALDMLFPPIQCEMCVTLWNELHF